MPWNLRVALATAALASTALGVAACGDDNNTAKRAAAPAKGGTLTMFTGGDIDSIDPAGAYSTYSFLVHTTTQRPLMAYKPGDDVHPVPDLAAAAPKVSRDGRELTVTIRRGVRFSPPVSREVTAEDVRYGIERGFKPSVANGYTSYFDLVGAGDFAAGKARSIAGLQVRGRYTLTMRLSSPTAAVSAGALVMPLTAPVPREYAARYDARKRSTYGEHQVATGPYMIANDGRGKLTGFRPGREIRLVRNPSWDARTDFRPALLDGVDIKVAANPDVQGRRILEGRGMASSSELPIAPEILKRAVTRHRSQTALVPAKGQYYVALNTKIGPLRNLNVRRAIVAAFDREAMLLAKGGRTLGQIPTHFLPPGTSGFAESGGDRGFGLDFMAHPPGDMRLAADYMRKAGYPSGRYTGRETLLMVGVAGGSSQRQAEVAQSQLTKLGFKVKLHLAAGPTMIGKFCGVPRSRTAICANVGWSRDFADASTMLRPTFEGAAIQPAGNMNWPQLDVPAIDRAIEHANVVVDPAERARAWAQVNRLITEQAPAVNWTWDRAPAIESADVNGVVARAYNSWDLSFTSLKQPKA
jgi:peptide/nickel transport system substrate-binding protein